MLYSYQSDVYCIVASSILDVLHSCGSNSECVTFLQVFHLWNIFAGLNSYLFNLMRVTYLIVQSKAGYIFESLILGMHVGPDLIYM